MEDVHENEDEEKVVVSGDVSCAAMLAGAALRAAAASAAAMAGRMEGMSSGCGSGEGGWGGLALTWRPEGADSVGSGGRGRRGAAVSAFWVRLGWAPAMGEGVWVGVRGGQQLAWAAFGGRGGPAWGFRGVCGVCVPVTGQVGCAVGGWAPRSGCLWLPGVGDGEGCSAGGSVASVCGCMGGRGRPVSRGPGLRALVGVCAPQGGEWGGGGTGGGCVGRCGAGFACVVSMYVSACSGAPVWSRVGRAVWMRSLPSSADVTRISQMSVRIGCTSWSVVGSGNFSAGLRSMRPRTLWMA